jgi:glycosyltransferase involved in cell wall biosynthesis
MQNNHKIYINNPRESWITDRFRKEWIENNKDTSKFLFKSSIIWLIAPWQWEKISTHHLKSKKVVCTIHHIDETKFDKKEIDNFAKRDLFVDYYHVPSIKTFNQVKNLTSKRIFTIPFWINQNIFKDIKDKTSLREAYKIDKDAFTVGSFQRDTEGYDLQSPKLSKGPDIFIDNILELRKKEKNLLVLLAGYRRHYVINELNKHNIPFMYFERTSLKIINDLYNCLNLYLVTSRVEGGPAAITECAISKTPIISRDVGLAREFLHANSIANDNLTTNAKPDTSYAYEKTKHISIPNGMEKFKEMFLYEN